MIRLTAISIAAVLSVVVSAEAMEAVWVGPATGAWNDPANWSTGAVPTNTAVRIDDNSAQESRVEHTTGFAFNTLLNLDAGDTLAVLPTATLNFSIAQVVGDLSIEGGTFNAPLLALNGGELRLTGGSSRVSSLSSIHNTGSIIGGGLISVGNTTSGIVKELDNEGEIRAELPTSPLSIELAGSANVKNDGRLMAIDGGWLKLLGPSFTSTNRVLGGRIEAHPGSMVTLGATSRQITVEDAVLAVVDDIDPLTSAPQFEFIRAILRNVTLEGSIPLVGATLEGTITNLGEIRVPVVGGSTSFPQMSIEGDVYLAGGGSVTLEGPGTPTPLAFGGSGRLFNVDNVIRGLGHVTWVGQPGFTNRGVVQADTPHPLTYLAFHGSNEIAYVNSGVMKAINGGRLRLVGGSWENFEETDPGRIVAGENSVVELETIRIVGGVLRGEGSNPQMLGTFEVLGNSVVLQDVAVEGEFRSTTNSFVMLEGQIQNRGILAAKTRVSSAVTLAGGGELVAERDNWLQFSGIPSLINEDNFIHGTGAVLINTTAGIPITNRGTIRADDVLTMIDHRLQFTNGGRLEAGPGGQLRLPPFTIVNHEAGAAGIIHAADGGLVTLGGVRGGMISTDGSGVVRATDFTVEDIHNTGTLEIINVTLGGRIVNDGAIKGRAVRSSPFLTLSGSGRWETSSSSLLSGIFTNGPEHSIVGEDSLSVDGILINQGTIVPKSGESFHVFGTAVQNVGLMHAPSDSMLGLQSLARVENEGTMRLEGEAGILAGAGLHNLAGGLIELGGTLTLEITGLRNHDGGLVAGNGSILGAIGGESIVNEGTISPGPGLAMLSIGDDFEQHATGRLELDILGGAMPASDLISVTGLVTLGGTLDARLVGVDELTLGDSFTLLTAANGISGVFDELLLPILSEGMFWHVRYLAQEVRATVAAVIPGDFNLDGSVDAADYVHWRKGLGTTHTQEAYDTWLSNFGQIAGNGSANDTTIPEPAGIWLLLSAVAAAIALRLRSLRRDVAVR